MRTRSWRAPAALALLALTLGACGSTTGTSGSFSTYRDALNFGSTNLPVAYTNEPYTAPLNIAGGTSPYTVRVVSGTLPPGLKLNGTTLSGTPTAGGTYTFTLEAGDANLSTKVQPFNMSVSTLPPTALVPTLPSTDLRAETRVPLVLNYPRQTRALRFTWPLPEGVTVSAVTPGDGRPVVFWKQSGRTLSVDMGFRAAPKTGARVALVTLKPAKAVRLSAEGTTIAARNGEGKLIGQAPAPATPDKPADKAPAVDGKTDTPAPTPGTTGTPAATPTTPADAPTTPAPAPTDGGAPTPGATPTPPADGTTTPPAPTPTPQPGGK
ncbi:Ig domain-containing protein [Deinococcus maricopensis]|uniref:Ig family protein n=1 Tax=Deinococcus maricopensis (strain DSM 21211 / LMG 22137 / NRRL B-23946 / LB-34) TaxID=709986 RepID=E8U8F6_DEIML|nr:Ig domain-containing protein [Deinococcus maricopensis]ADV67345.1 Ig family protein [Deinococcus maricopensis DSM 21211]